MTATVRFGPNWPRLRRQNLRPSWEMRRARASTAEHVLAVFARARRGQCGGRDRRPRGPDHGWQRGHLRRGDRPGRHRDPRRVRRFIGVLKPSGSRPEAPTANSGRIRADSRIEAEIQFDHPLIGRQASTSTADRKVPFTRSRGRAPSASCATWPSSGVPATRSALRSKTRSWSPTMGAQSRRHPLPRRIRAPQGPRAIGDLALAGAPVLGAYRTVRGGHQLQLAEPVRERRGHANFAAALVAPAYAPDVS